MKNTFIHQVLGLTLSLTLIFACDTQEDTEPAEVFVPSFLANDNVSALNTRVTSSQGVAVSFSVNSGNNVSFTKRAEISPNTINGQQLSATGVDYLNNNVYVSYHVRGEGYGGEILTFDVSDPSNPNLLKSLTDTTADFNDIMIGQHRGNIWVAGARDIYTSRYTDTDGAIATKIGLNGNDKLPKSTATWEVPLASYSASSITRVDPPAGQSNGRIYITSGSRGGLTVVRGNNENQVYHERSVIEAKHFDYYDGKGVFLRGNGDGTSSIDIYSLDDTFAYQTIQIGFDVTYLGKNGVEVDGDYAYLAMGDDGVVMVSLTNGTVEGVFNPNGSGFTNAVAVDDDFLYVANGADGLFILDKHSLEVKANYKFNGSCNYVSIKDNLIFLANGDSGGLIILERN